MISSNHPADAWASGVEISRDTVEFFSSPGQQQLKVVCTDRDSRYHGNPDGFLMFSAFVRECSNEGTWSVIRTCNKFWKSSSMSPHMSRKTSSMRRSTLTFIPHHDCIYGVPGHVSSFNGNLTQYASLTRAVSGIRRCDGRVTCRVSGGRM